MRSSLRAAIATCAGLLVACSAPPAHAWYFPEHVVIAKDALEELPPEVREVLRTAVDAARVEGLSLCATVDVGLEDLSPTKPLHTRMLRAEAGVDCVPYAALPALAADHASSTGELRVVLGSEKGLELTTAAAYEWRRFLDAVDKLPTTPLERMSFVHELDVDFYFIDPGYELRAQATRAHFVDAGRPLEDVVRNAGLAGAVDNAVGQFLAHHIRSLELAAHRRSGEALLEHGFALHMLEDAFSAGHLVMTDRTWANGNTRARRRHDFFDAKGLAVRRALSAEPCAALDQSFEVGVPPCWVTTGDGYLGLAADSSDRVHVVRAVKKAQLQLAMALDPARVVSFVEGLGEREQIAFGDMFDPMPWWTVPRQERRRRVATAEHAKRLVRGAADAVVTLRRAAVTPAVHVGTPPGRAVFAAHVASALEPCSRRAPDDAAAPDDDLDGCGADRVLAIGTVGASLVRPLLVELPAAQDDVSKLEGEAPADHGLAFQLLASASAGALLPARAPVDFFAPALGVSVGLAYRFGTYLPGRRNRSALEVNLGISGALHYDAHGRSGGNPQVVMLEQELRWPILWELLTSYLLPLNLRESHQAGTFIVFGGARVREILTDPTPRIWGVEIEAAAFALSSGRGSYPLYSAAPDLRFYVGLGDPSAAQPSLPPTWGPTIGITFVGGYATFL